MHRLMSVHDFNFEVIKLPEIGKFREAVGEVEVTEEIIKICLGEPEMRWF